MKILILLSFIFFGCQTKTKEQFSTIDTLTKTIDRTLEKKKEHINYYLGVEVPELDHLISASIEIKQIVCDSVKAGGEYISVKNLIRSKYKDLILYDDWTTKIDSTLTGTALRINILANELSFINRLVDFLERGKEYSFKQMGLLTKDEKNITKVYITARMVNSISEILFADSVNDSLQFTGGIKDTMRIVARQNDDYYTIVNKDGMNYKYVLKFAKANGTFEYFRIK